MKTEAQIQKQVRQLKEFLLSNPQHRREWQLIISDAATKFMERIERDK